VPRTAVRQLQHEALQMLAQLDQVHAQLAMLQAGLTAAGDCTAAANERAAVAEERAAAAEAAAESCEQAKAHVQLEDVQPEVLELQARVAELGAAREELDTLEHRHEQCLPLLTALAQEKRPRTNTPRTKDCFCVARQALESFMVERIEEWHVFQVHYYLSIYLFYHTTILPLYLSLLPYYLSIYLTDRRVACLSGVGGEL
jgi:hypothetical protein